MKKNLVLIICFLSATFPSIESSNEKMWSYPSKFQMQKPNNLISPSGFRLNEKIQRLLYRLGSVDSNCFKSIHNQFHYKNRSVYRRPFGMIKPLQMSAFRNDGSNQKIPFFYRMRQNLIKERPDTQRPFGNDRIIFVPPYLKSNKKRVDFFQNANEFNRRKTSQPNSYEDLSNQKPKKVMNETRQEILVEENPKQIQESIKHMKKIFADRENRETEKQYTLENSTAFDDVPEISKTAETSTYNISEITQIFNKTKSTTETYFKISPHHLWYQEKPTQTQQYEVEEIIEEGLSINFDKEKVDNVKNISFDGALLAKEKKKVTNSENGQKMNSIQDMMGSSISTVIKSLISPMIKVFPTIGNNQETFPKEKIQNRPVFNNYSTITTPPFITFSGQRPPNIHKITNSSGPFLHDRHEQSKCLKMKNPRVNKKFQNWTLQTTESAAASKEVTPELISGSRISMMPPSRTEYYKNVHTTATTETLYTPLGVPKPEKKIINVKENPQHTTTVVTEIKSISLPSSEPSDPISFTLHETQKILKSITTQKILSEKIENHSTVSSETQTTLNKILSSQELTTAKSIQTTDLLDEFNENFTEALTTSKVQYVKYDEPLSGIAINKTNLTIPEFRGFIDHFRTFDSITTIKSDFKKNQDTMGKNGRKLHFLHELEKTTTSNLITELGNTGPRRSDILITENFNDYVEDDNNLSTLNYLDKLIQNNSFPYRNSLLHPKFESIIPLIPIVVNHLREGRISPKDVLILSKAFGKYWSSIMVLANVTNLDMLPLLKMKNEKDWNNIWQSFLPESTNNTELTTVKTTEIYPKQDGNDYSPYDYLAEYENFYEYVFESEKEEKEKKRKKARLKRDEKDNLKQIETFREYFESTEKEKGNFIFDNMYEDMLYIETRDKDSSKFEVKLKSADQNFHKVTSQ